MISSAGFHMTLEGQLFTPIYPYRSSQKGKGTVQDHMYSLWRLSDKIIFREIFWSLNAETHPVFDEEFFVLEDAFISCEIFQCGS